MNENDGIKSNIGMPEWLHKPEVFSRITDAVRDAVVIIDGDSTVWYWNNAAEEMFGYSREEIVGNSLYDFITLEKCSREHREGMFKFRETGRGKLVNQIVAVTALKKDRTEFPIELSVSPLPVGDKWYAVGVVRDITERKRVEKELAMSEARYRRLFETAKDGILIIDADTGEITDSNAAIEEELGYMKAELLGKKAWDVGFLKDVTASRERFWEVIEKGSIRYEGLPLKKKDGRSIEAEFVSSVYSLDGKKVVQSTIRDITDRVRAEEALEESAERYRELADSLPQIVFEIDRGGNLTFINRFAFALMGYSREDFEKGINVLQMFVPADRVRLGENIQKILAGEQSASNEYEAQKKDGVVFPVITYSRPIISENKVAGVRGIAIDITEQKKREEELRSRTEELERLNKFMIGRELKMAELKKEIEELKAKSSA